MKKYIKKKDIKIFKVIIKVFKKICKYFYINK